MLSLVSKNCAHFVLLFCSFCIFPPSRAAKMGNDLCGEKNINLEPYEIVRATISNNVSIHLSYLVKEWGERGRPAEREREDTLLLAHPFFSPFLFLCVPGSSRCRRDGRTEGIGFSLVHLQLTVHSYSTEAWPTRTHLHSSTFRCANISSEERSLGKQIWAN